MPDDGCLDPRLDEISTTIHLSPIQHYPPNPSPFDSVSNTGVNSFPQLAKSILVSTPPEFDSETEITESQTFSPMGPRDCSPMPNKATPSNSLNTILEEATENSKHDSSAIPSLTQETSTLELLNGIDLITMDFEQEPDTATCSQQLNLASRQHLSPKPTNEEPDKRQQISPRKCALPLTIDKDVQIFSPSSLRKLFPAASEMIEQQINIFDNGDLFGIPEHAQQLLHTSHPLLTHISEMISAGDNSTKYATDFLNSYSCSHIYCLTRSFSAWLAFCVKTHQNFYQPTTRNLLDFLADAPKTHIWWHHDHEECDLCL